MDGHTFLNAHFMDNERKTVRALWADENTSDIVESIIEVDENDYSWKQLMEHISINQLHENTYTYIQDSQRVIKEQVVSIAKENGWIYEINTENSRAAVKALLGNVFKPFDPVEGKEDLFFMKLEVFDLEFVRETKDRKAKAEIRKAATPAKVLELVCKMYDASLAEASADGSD
jgi:hypothetical protein|tara:strand:+ start:360 stop:881 length:522 start_codon:yes stop_codon:yes gene_type:complete